MLVPAPRAPTGGVASDFMAAMGSGRATRPGKRGTAGAMGDSLATPPYELDALLCELSIRRSDGSGSAGAYGETLPVLAARPVATGGGAASGSPRVVARSGSVSRILFRNKPTKRVSPWRSDVMSVRRCERWSRGLATKLLGSMGKRAMTSTST